MKAIMYHYVRQYNPALPYFRFLDFCNFRKQLDFFDSEFGFVTKDEWYYYLEDGSFPQDSGKIILTFDDAMRCHYDYVLPELIRRGLWGIFYVPSSPYSDGTMLDVHRIHVLCGRYRGATLLDVSRKLVREGMISGDKLAEFRNQTYTRQQNFEGVTEFKRLLNYFVDYRFRGDVISAIGDELGCSFDKEQFYVSADQLSEMKSYGMIIGSHTHTHPVMSRLSKESQRIEIDKSFAILSDFCDDIHKTYCHPYGGFHSFNSDTVAALIESGVSYAFNVESRQISIEDFSTSKLFLPRFDCNLFPHGKAS
jgi:peptidoglycan/xylan/chitin deacetylase (PgdA/CDA1 family)